MKCSLDDCIYVVYTVTRSKNDVDTIRKEDNMKMKDPPHPGSLVKQECLGPLSLSITKGAEILGVTRLTLSNLVNGKNGVSPEMAIRLSKAFGSSPKVWLGLQLDYDLAQAEKSSKQIKVKKAVPA